MKPVPFQYQLSITEEVIDELNHVNNVSYVQWIQNVAKKHWESHTPKSIRKKVGWVVLDHYIAYKNPSFLGEVLTLKTWIENYGNIKSERYTEIIRESDNKMIVTAKTTWCLIDLRTRKPTRITPEITEPYFE